MERISLYTKLVEESWHKEKERESSAGMIRVNKDKSNTAAAQGENSETLNVGWPQDSPEEGILIF